MGFYTELIFYIFGATFGVILGNFITEMFISKKEKQDIRRRLAELERSMTINTWSYGKVDLRTFAIKVEAELDAIKKTVSCN